MKPLKKMSIWWMVMPLVLGIALAQSPEDARVGQLVDVDVLLTLPFDSVDEERGIITLDGVEYELNLIDDGYFSRSEKWRSLKYLRPGKKYLVHVYFDNEAAMKNRKGGSVVYIGELPPPY